MLAQLPLGGLRVPGPEEDVEPVKIAVIYVDRRVHAGFLQVPDIGPGFIQERFPVQHIGVGRRKPGIVGFPGGRSIFRNRRGAVQVSQIMLPAPVVAACIPVAAVIVPGGRGIIAVQHRIQGDLERDRNPALVPRVQADGCREPAAGTFPADDQLVPPDTQLFRVVRHVLQGVITVLQRGRIGLFPGQAVSGGNYHGAILPREHPAAGAIDHGGHAGHVSAAVDPENTRNRPLLPGGAEDDQLLVPGAGGDMADFPNQSHTGVLSVGQVRNAHMQVYRTNKEKTIAGKASILTKKSIWCLIRPLFFVGRVGAGAPGVEEETTVSVLKTILQIIRELPDEDMDKFDWVYFYNKTGDHEEKNSQRTTDRDNKKSLCHFASDSEIERKRQKLDQPLLPKINR